MKKAFILLALVAVSCTDNKPFTGYVVGKEYNPSHNEIKYRTIHCGKIVTQIPYTEHVDSKYYIYLANKQNVKCFEVDSVKFKQIKKFQKITL